LAIQITSTDWSDGSVLICVLLERHWVLEQERWVGYWMVAF